MNILFIAAGFPFPPLKGYQVRAWHPLRLLGPRHTIDLAALSGAPVSANDLDAVRPLVRRLAVIPHGKTRQFASLVRGSLSPAPLQTSMFNSRRLQQQIDSWRREGHYDVAVIQLARLAGTLPALHGLPVVFDLIDALSANMRRRAESDRFPISWLAAREASRLHRLERDLCDRCAATIVVSQSDADAIGGVRPPSVIPNGVDKETFGWRDRAGRRDVIVSGNMGYFPNAEAALLLVRQIMPIVWAEMPQVRVRIVGDHPTAALRQLASERVIITGRVAEMAPHLQAAAVAAFPMLSGSGMQNKVLEAAACGTPIVTTTLAASGFADFVRGEHGLVADAPGDAARQIIALLRDAELSSRLARAARGWVEKHYTWDRSVQKLEELLNGCARFV